MLLNFDDSNWQLRRGKGIQVVEEADRCCFLCVFCFVLRTHSYSCEAVVVDKGKMANPSSNKRSNSSSGRGDHKGKDPKKGPKKHKKNSQGKSDEGWKHNSEGDDDLSGRRRVAGTTIENRVNSVGDNTKQVILPVKGASADAAAGEDGKGAPAKKKVNLGYMKYDKPKTANELTVAMEKDLKITVDAAIFPYTKFVKKDSELEESGYLYLAFQNAGLSGKKDEKAAERIRYWKAYLDYMKARLNERRSTAIGAVKMAAISK